MDKKKILGLFAALGAVAGWAISFVGVIISNKGK